MACKGEVLLGVWTSKKTLARRKPIEDTWFNPECVVWLSCCPIPVKNVIVTGGPDTYLAVTFRGLKGLSLMRQQYPNFRWYGVLGDDNYVHWPFLLEGLTRLRGAHVVGEMAYIKKTKKWRFMGGAGIFTSANFTDKLPLDLWARSSLKLNLLHDTFFSTYVRDHFPGLLTHADFLYSSEPALYVCGPSKHMSSTWSEHPPAVFHRFRTPADMHQIHAIAMTGALKSTADRAKDGIMLRTTALAKTTCSAATIADTLCAAWRNCPSSRDADPPQGSLFNSTRLF